MFSKLDYIRSIGNYIGTNLETKMSINYSMIQTNKTKSVKKK